MSKQIFCLAGLHRSGNTLLSALLQQNPDIYVSPLSPLADILEKTYEQVCNDLDLKATNRYDLAHNMLGDMPSSFYKEIEQPIIFDRQKTWGTPKHFFLAKSYIDANVKVVFTKRPILEILASIITVYGKTLNRQMEALGWVWKPYLTENDNKCDFLMSPLWYLDKLFSTYTTMKNYPDHFHVIDYNTLLDSPNDTMKDLYTFLGLDSFTHSFENIEHEKDYRADLISLPGNLHDVKSTLEKTTIKISDVLSEYAINKYQEK